MADDKRRGTILVVDDNPDVRHLAKRLLETAGHSVITAADGAQALRLYAQHQEGIVLLLTDVTMPNIGGLELANCVRGMNSQIPVLFMSGDVSSAYLGAQLIEKPFRPADLIETVDRVLHANASAQKQVSA